jgi:hypothetical protein
MFMQVSDPFGYDGETGAYCGISLLTGIVTSQTTSQERSRLPHWNAFSTIPNDIQSQGKADHALHSLGIWLTHRISTASSRERYV